MFVSDDTDDCCSKLYFNPPTLIQTDIASIEYIGTIFDEAQLKFIAIYLSIKYDGTSTIYSLPSITHWLSSVLGEGCIKIIYVVPNSYIVLHDSGEVALYIQTDHDKEIVKTVINEHVVSMSRLCEFVCMLHTNGTIIWSVIEKGAVVRNDILPLAGCSRFEFGYERNDSVLRDWHGRGAQCTARQEGG